MAEDGAKKTPSKGAKKRRLSNDYQTPEYITVDVSEPHTTYENGKPQYTTYKITTETTLPNFSSKNFSVRRRYSEFVWLRDHIRQKMDEKGKRLTIADLPGNTISSFFGSGRFEPDFIEERRKGLEAFLQSVVNHPWARFEEGLHKFLEDQSFVCGDGK